MPAPRFPVEAGSNALLGLGDALFDVLRALGRGRMRTHHIALAAVQFGQLLERRDQATGIEFLGLDQVERVVVGSASCDCENCALMNFSVRLPSCDLFSAATVAPPAASAASRAAETVQAVCMAFLL